MASRNSNFHKKDEMKYLEWYISETGCRVDAIVGGKHRGSYHKAARLIIAVAEVLAKRGRKTDGAFLVKQYYKKYPSTGPFY